MSNWITVIGTSILTYALYKIAQKFTPEKSFAGQNVLITGAGSGLGRLLALEFIKLKATVILLDINDVGIKSVASEIQNAGGRAITKVCDVSDKDSVRKMAEEVKNEVGKVDVLINNAGIVSGGFVWELKEENMERVIKVNTLAIMYMIKAFLPDMMKDNKGHLITIASSAAISAAPKLADYCASKAAAFIFHEGVRLELKKIGKTGIDTLSVNPYYINTGMFDGVVSNNPLLPILDQHYVVSRIMSAARTRQEELFIPGTMFLMFLSRFLWASNIRDKGLHLT